MLTMTGLSEAEAARRLAAIGYNELPSAKSRSNIRIGLDVLKEPMLLLLLGCSLTYFVLGDIQEALVLFGFVVVVIGIELYQERKTERALEALRDLSSPRALVIRDGERKRIAGREVVPGDLVVLDEGDRVPADGVLLAATNLAADESLLTGESVPVRKVEQEGDAQMGRPGGDDLPFVFSGSLIVRGTAIALVLKTGVETELGKIGKSLQSVAVEPSLLQKDTYNLVRLIALGALILCAFVVFVYGWTRGDWLHGFLAALTLAMAILPEELPVVLTVFLALGAWRISRIRVLTRQIPAIESLGAATVLCVDKTGTLTMNRMSVCKLYAAGEYLEIPKGGPAQLPEQFHELIEFALLASQIEAFDPMDRAISRLAATALAGTEHLHRDWTLTRQYPLARSLLAVSQVWNSPDGTEFVIAAKGAPEAIMGLCHAGRAEADRVSAAVSHLSDEGLRVLGTAKSHFRKTELPRDQHDFEFQFLGLIALDDPIRESVPQAVQECRKAGIRVAMITGDFPGTAASIASEIGLGNSSAIVTGPEMEAMDDRDLQERVGAVNVFARVARPEAPARGSPEGNRRDRRDERRWRK
jgi:Ca2+-transporting ATPase